MAPELGRVLLIENRPYLLAATRNVRKSKLSGQFGTPVCTTVTAALAVGRFCDSSRASGRPSVVPRPRMQTPLPDTGIS